MDILHVWSQEAFHDDVYIVGNKPSLIMLRDLIDNAINVGFTSRDDFMVNDGEGYSVGVFNIPESMNDKMAVPYTRDYAKEKSEIAIYPWKIQKYAAKRIEELERENKELKEMLEDYRKESPFG